LGGNFHLILSGYDDDELPGAPGSWP